MITIDEYKKSQVELNKIQDETEKQNKIFDEEHNANYNKFYDLESKLSERKRTAEHKLTKKRESYRTKVQDKEKPYVEKIQAYKRILIFVEMHKGERDTSFKVYNFDYPRDETGEVIRVQRGNCLDYPDKIEIPYIPMATIKDDKYAKIQAFIVDNDKPKNKYSLIVVGKSIFQEELFKGSRHPYWYGYGCHVSNNNIIIGLQDRPTKEELISYFEKNKAKTLKDYLEEHRQIEKEYEETIRQTDNKEWELAYWENQKDYYENHYSHGTETEEYKKVLKKIKGLKR